VNSKKLKKGAWLIWHAMLWAIWKERNARIFRIQTRDLDDIVEGIKLESWFWVLSRLKVASCLFMNGRGILESALSVYKVLLRFGRRFLQL